MLKAPHLVHYKVVYDNLHIPFVSVLFMVFLYTQYSL